MRAPAGEADRDALPKPAVRACHQAGSPFEPHLGIDRSDLRLLASLIEHAAQDRGDRVTMRSFDHSRRTLENSARLSTTSRHLDVLTHHGVQTHEHRPRHERMTDRHLLHVRHREKRRQVLEVEIMPGVDA